MKNKLLKVAEYAAFGVAILIVVVVTLGVRSSFHALSSPIAEEPVATTSSVAVTAMATPTAPAQTPVTSAPTYLLKLSDKNTFVFRGVVTDESVANALQTIILKSNALDKSEVFYLVLDTPGGDVMAGMRFIDSLHALPQTVKAVVIFAASMGFQITQNLSERLITPGGTLMSHRMRATLEGQVPGELNSRLAFISSFGDTLDAVAATRMGIDVPTYRQRIINEYWVTGVSSIKDRAADKLVVIRCAPDLMGTEQVAIRTFFGVVKVTFSKCPAIIGPLGVAFDQLKFKNGEDQRIVKEYIDALFNDRVWFVEKYIVNNTYKNVQIN